MKMNRNRIHIDKLPDSIFCEAIQVYDIASAEILSASRRKYGETDVIVHRIDGRDIRISRLELIRDYRYIDGGVIKLSYWRNDTKIPVIKIENKLVAVLYINSDKVIEYGGKLDGCKVDGEEYYIVCDIVDGNIDRSRYKVILRDKFIRAYRLRDTLNIDIIRNDLGLGNGGTESQELDSYIGYDFRDEDGLEDTKYIVSENDKQYKDDNIVYRATGRVVKDNITIGFILTGDYGEMRVNKKDLLKLVLEGRVRNIEYTDKGGNYTLIGKGMRISDLPIADSK